MRCLWVLIASFLLFYRLEANDSSKEGSGFEAENEDDEFEESNSGDGSIDQDRRTNVSISHRVPPSRVEEDEDPYGEEEEEDADAGRRNGGAGIVFEDDPKSEGADRSADEPVAVKQNSLMTHPGILAAIIVGGILVLVCLVVFFILIICCVRKKDEGTYDLDRAMKEKLKYITYTKSDTSDREFFA